MTTEIVAKAVVVTEDGQALLLTRSADDAKRPGGFDLPGGGVEEEVLTLDEMITLVDRRARLMIEIKTGVAPEPIVLVLRHYLARGWQAKDFSIASFDYPLLRTMYRALPEIDRIVLEPWLGLRAMWRARQLQTKYLSMNQQFLWWGFIRWATQRGHKIYTYPYPRTRLPFNHRKPNRWARHGLYGIITDHPEIFR